METEMSEAQNGVAEKNLGLFKSQGKVLMEHVNNPSSRNQKTMRIAGHILSCLLILGVFLLFGCSGDSGSAECEKYLKNVTYYTAHKDLERKCYEQSIKKALANKVPESSIKEIVLTIETSMKGIGVDIGLSPEEQKKDLEKILK